MVRVLDSIGGELWILVTQFLSLGEVIFGEILAVDGDAVVLRGNEAAKEFISARFMLDELVMLPGRVSVLLVLLRVAGEDRFGSIVVEDVD